MGYIIKKGGGAGTGDATAANQTTQITEAQTTNNYIFDGVRSVFKDGSNSSFNDNAGASVFKTGGDSVFNFPLGAPFPNESAIVKPIYNNSANPFLVTSFTAGSLAATTALFTTWLAANSACIVNISFSQSALSHDILVVYAL